MNRSSVSTLVVSLSLVLMGLSAVKAHAGPPSGTTTCGIGKLGCKDWTTVPDPGGQTNPGGDPVHHTCSTFAFNYKNYVTRAWGCKLDNSIVNDTCDENQSENDCCRDLSDPNPNCGNVTASCPCPAQ